MEWRLEHKNEGNKGSYSHEPIPLTDPQLHQATRDTDLRVYSTKEDHPVHKHSAMTFNTAGNIASGTGEMLKSAHLNVSNDHLTHKRENLMTGAAATDNNLDVSGIGIAVV